MSALGQSRPSDRRQRASYVCFAPKSDIERSTAHYFIEACPLTQAIAALQGRTLGQGRGDQLMPARLALIETLSFVQFWGCPFRKFYPAWIRATESSHHWGLYWGLYKGCFSEHTYVRTAPEEPWHRSNPNLDSPP